MTRRCKKCGEEKDINEFVKKKTQQGKEYYLYTCIYCNKKYHKTYNVIFYNDHKDQLIDTAKQWYQDNKEKKKEYDKTYYVENKSDKQEYDKQYRKVNKNRISTRISQYRKIRRQNDPLYKLRKNVSFNIWYQLNTKGSSKNNNSVLDFLPYSIRELKEWLEKQFEPWMTWTNYGNYNAKTWDDNNLTTWTWQVDHIIPQSSFGFLSMSDDGFQKCWALENLRPLSAKQNVIDGARK